MEFLYLDPPKHLFLFNSFGFTGFKDFIIQDDQKIINKILYGINDFNKRNVANIIVMLSLLLCFKGLNQYSQTRQANKVCN